MSNKKKLNRAIRKRIEYNQYKLQHPDECWCPENDVQYPDVAQNLDFENPVHGDTSNGIFKCTICNKNKPYQFPHA